MIRPARVVLVLVVVIAAALAVGVFAVFQNHTPVPTFDEAPVQVSVPVDATLLVRPDSPVLSGSLDSTGEASDDVVTVVEFTDPQLRTVSHHLLRHGAHPGGLRRQGALRAAPIPRTGGRDR